MEDVTFTSLLLRFGAVAFLLAANGFFVAAEFALVAARRTRIESMVRDGDKRAQSVLTALKDLNRQLSSAQLGITVASILLGYVAEETVAVFLHDWFASLPSPLDFLARATIVSIVAVSVITFLHVVIGEQAPKTWAITYPERTSRWAARPLMVFTWITLPLTNLLNWSATKLLRLFGIKADAGHHRAHSPDEIVMMVRKAQQMGHFASQDVEMIEGLMVFTEKTARDVMTPRTDVAVFQASMTIARAAAHAAEVGRSRYPVINDSVDDIVGVVHVKQMLAALSTHPEESITTLARDPIFVPGSREIEDVLADMRRHQFHLAVVLDEYGGTAGIVTMEDMVEEIVGEIFDEHDEGALLPEAGTDGIVLPGDTDLDDVNERYELELNSESYQTIGGLVFSVIGRLPKVGDVIVVEGTRLEVDSMDGRRIGKVKLTPGSAP